MKSICICVTFLIIQTSVTILTCSPYTHLDRFKYTCKRFIGLYSRLLDALEYFSFKHILFRFISFNMFPLSVAW